jgi:hypothetical protein
MNARTPLLAACVVSTMLTACSSLSRDFCEAAASCDELNAELFGFGLDSVGSGSDSVDVCVVDNDGALAVLRANKEDVCHELAAAVEEFMACAAEEGDCGGFNLVGNECASELDRVNDLRGEADDECDTNDD